VAAEFHVPIIALDRCDSEVVTAKLERPDGYQFRAGQWFRVTLDTPEGPQTRTFSHAAAPADNWIEFTTRLSSSPFKQALETLSLGDLVQIGPAGGRLSLPQGVDAFTFLVGGVGITPIRSMLRDAVSAGRVFGDALVIYGNRDASCEKYLDELLSMDKAGVRVVRVLEHPEGNWSGERGFVTADLVRRHGGDRPERVFIVAGPPVMVEAMLRVLDELGVSKDAIRFESFGTIGAAAS